MELLVSKDSSSTRSLYESLFFPTENTNTAIYGNLTYHFTDKTALSVGARALKDEIKRQEALGGKIELPEVHIRGDKDVAYRCVGGVVFTMQRAGFRKVGFISEPIPGFVTRD